MSRPSILPRSRSVPLLLGPLWLYYGLFLLVPVLTVVVISFLQAGDYGGVVVKFNTDAYVNLLFQRDYDGSLEFDPSFVMVASRSLMMSFLTTSITLLIGFPTAYWIASQPERRRNLLMLLIVIPFWTSLLTRIYAWIIILGTNGIVEHALQSVIPGFQMNFLYTPQAILLGMCYTYLPVMVLTIYSSLEKLDFRLIQASRDLYASPFETLWLVVVPLCSAGIVSGISLVLIPSLGDVVVPMILGGGRFMMFGNYVVQQFQEARNWPFGAAMGMTILCLVAVSAVLVGRVAKFARARAYAS